ncbi:MAG: tripartite tricarboxylate transporter substrate-binding protein [Candidatus Ornithospirochaeta sp.]
MKKLLSVCTLALVVLAAVFAQGNAETSADGAFVLKSNVDFYVSSSAGGGSDIFTRTITDIASSKGLVEKPFIVNNMPDGNGQVSRRNVAMSKSPDSTLLCFSSGDLTSMITNGGLSMADFKAVAILASDKHLGFIGKNGSYKNFEEVLAAAKSGKKITVGGTKSDEKVLYNMFLAETGLEGSFTYITYGSAAETMAAILGGHVDMGLSKPAASKQYVLSGDVIPAVAFSTERFEAPFDTAPTLTEFGYNAVENPMWRAVIASKNMSDGALEFWAGVLKAISESDEWKANYLSKNLLVGQYVGPAEAQEIMLATEKEILANK